MAKRFLLSSVARLTRQSVPAAVSTTGRRHLLTVVGNNATAQASSRSLLVPAATPLLVRYFETEAAYSNVADQTLETIQDTIDEVLDELPAVEYELSYASGVLTFSLPGHGTWVLNKQTPNQQIWVSFVVYCVWLQSTS